MLSIWQLPAKATIGGRIYDIHGDFRDILEIFSYLNDQSLPLSFRWSIALGLFYEQPVEPEHQQEAIRYLCSFINPAGEQNHKTGPSLMDWQLDGELIVADVNRAAGQEIRLLPFVHWWTFLSWFHTIGPGQLSTVVSIRDKLRRGKKLDSWERDYYLEHKDRVDMKRPLSEEEKQHKQMLEKLLE